MSKSRLDEVADTLDDFYLKKIPRGAQMLAVLAAILVQLREINDAIKKQMIGQEAGDE